MAHNNFNENKKKKTLISIKISFRFFPNPFQKKNKRKSEWNIVEIIDNN